MNIASGSRHRSDKDVNEDTQQNPESIFRRLLASTVPDYGSAIVESNEDADDEGSMSSDSDDYYSEEDGDENIASNNDALDEKPAASIHDESDWETEEDAVEDGRRSSYVSFPEFVTTESRRPTPFQGSDSDIESLRQRARSFDMDGLGEKFEDAIEASPTDDQSDLVSTTPENIGGDDAGEERRRKPWQIEALFACRLICVKLREEFLDPNRRGFRRIEESRAEANSAAAGAEGGTENGHWGRRKPVGTNSPLRISVSVS
ncbi:hypothetical protein BJ170DRAFT_607315 [Xylariales sp. AK1849]|nr:hypothetical protein BJ170DRAFT_607315 [Xylariales sp. AK1849]